MKHGDKVTLLTGKYRGKEAYVRYGLRKRHCNYPQQYCVNVQTGLGWKTLVCNETNLRRKRS
mgnify:CR=1 FL=1